MDHEGQGNRHDARAMRGASRLQDGLMTYDQILRKAAIRTQ